MVEHDESVNGAGVPRALSRLQEAMDCVDLSMGQLEKRMDSVLIHAEPSANQDNAKPSSSPPESALACHINELAGRLEHRLRDINSMLHRCDL